MKIASQLSVRVTGQLVDAPTRILYTMVFVLKMSILYFMQLLYLMQRCVIYCMEAWGGFSMLHVDKMFKNARKWSLTPSTY